MVATARLLMPRSIIRLSSGRVDLSFSEQGFCFLAGANSIFLGEKLLTVANPTYDADEKLLTIFGLTKREPFKEILK